MMNETMNKAMKRMKRVVITLNGRKAEVDADQASLLLKKEAQVEACINLKLFISADPVGHAYANDVLNRGIANIQRMNKRIRHTVRFLEV
jgi:hypothetical protein